MCVPVGLVVVHSCCNGVISFVLIRSYSFPFFPPPSLYLDQRPMILQCRLPRGWPEGLTSLPWKGEGV